jgi:hypothetical protein
MKKRILAMVMTVVMLCVVIVNTVYTATAASDDETVYVGDFNLYEYRADVYLKDGTVCNNNIKNIMTTNLPSQAVVDYLDNNTNFQSTVTAWKAAHYATKPSEIAEGGIDEKGYYTAIIMSVFKVETADSDYIFDSCKKITSETNGILSNMKNWVKESDQVELDKISKNQIIQTLSVDEQKEISKYLGGQFEELHPQLDLSGDLAEKLSAIFDAAYTVEDAIELMATYVSMVEMSENMKAVLLDLYNNCPSDNQALKSALKESAQAMESFDAGIDATIKNTAEKEVVDVLGTCVDEAWTTIIQANPYAKAFMMGAQVGTWLGDMICNTLFSTNETVEQYEKMKCLNEFTALLRNTVTNMGNTYSNNKSTENASNYFAAIDALYSAADLSCEFAEKYAKILYEDTALGWLTISNANYQNYMNSVKNIQECCEDNQKTLYTSYLCELEYDYPDIYEILFSTNDEDVDPVAVTGISFSRESMTISTNKNNIYMVDTPTITPSNATNQKVTYSSSDTTIVDVNKKWGFLTVKKEGTVTITATSEDGGYTASMRVIVDDSAEDAWENVSYSEAVASGTCGDDVSWSLNVNGVLHIYGSGEMADYTYADSTSPFCHNEDIKRVIIDEGVTGIGNYAFKYCSSLTSINIPESITSIGKGSFYYCSSLTCINIPESVTSIGYGAFEYCQKLINISVPQDVRIIDCYTFKGCSSLTSVSIPESVTRIEYNAFSGCSSLTYVNIPEGVKGIATATFENCDSLISVSMPERLELINEYAFKNCSSLTSINIPDGVTIIGSDAFKNCSSLTSLTIPDSVTSIGCGAFEGCTNLTIYGKSGSYAETYASENSIPFKAIGKTTVKVATPTLSSVANTQTGIKVTWKKATNASGYVVYRKASGGKWTKIKTLSGANTLSYIDTAVADKSGSTYSYSVQAYNKATDGTVTYGDYNKTGKSIRRLAQVTLGTPVNTAKGVTVKWSKVTGASGYIVYRKAGSAKSWTKVAKVAGNTKVSYLDTKAKTNGTKYTYTVKAYYGSTTGSANQTGKALYYVSPTSLTGLKNATSKSVTVKWKKNAKATGYQIQYSTSSKFTSAKTLTVKGSSSLSKTLSKLTKGKTYYVRVRAYKKGGSASYYSAWSAAKNVKVSK